MGYNRPSVVAEAAKKKLITCMITDNTPEKCIATIRNAIFSGADAFYLDITKLENEYRNIDSMKRIFDYCEDKPAIVYCYRRENRPDMTDQRIGDTLLMAVEAGASMCDIVGDSFAPNPLQLTFEEEAIQKQKELTDRIHDAGGEVLMSSHVWQHMTNEELLTHVLALEKRNADMVKLACIATNEAEMLDAIKLTVEMKNVLHVPFIHICLGQYGKLHRAISPMLGASMSLCVETYDEINLKDQPLVRSEKAVFDNLDWKMARDSSYGTVHAQRKDYY